MLHKRHNLRIFCHFQAPQSNTEILKQCFWGYEFRESLRTLRNYLHTCIRSVKQEGWMRERAIYHGFEALIRGWYSTKSKTPEQRTKDTEVFRQALMRQMLENKGFTTEHIDRNLNGPLPKSNTLNGWLCADVVEIRLIVKKVL